MKPHLIFCAALLAGACTTELEDNGRTPDTGGMGLENGKIVEDQSIYANDGISVIRVEIDVTDDSPFTLEEVNADVNPRDAFTPEARVRLEIADLDEPPGTEANASMRLRGDTTRLAPQKSYRVLLDVDAGRWRGQDRLQLNKHPFDLTRLRNKLSFDLFSQLDDITSLRTQFVHLFINGEDHGLYTHIEHYGELFLLNHGLDTRAPLYKAQNFFFDANNSAMRLEEDPRYDEEAFEATLEIKGSDDHGPLLEMLRAVTDASVEDFQPVFDRYFNEDNFITWLGTAILFGNIDTIERNFYIYSPRNSNQWFFLPWDYDDAWGIHEQPASEPLSRRRWQEGLANWSIAPMFRKWLEQPGNIARLTARIEQLHAKITPARIQSLVDAYLAVMGDRPLQLPDADELPTSAEELSPAQAEAYLAEVNRLSETVNSEFAVYQATLNRPFSYFQGVPEPTADGGIAYFWDRSFDPGGGQITYDIAVSTTPTFEPENIVFSREGLSDNSFTDSTGLPAGTYYFRVLARSSNNPEDFQTSAETFRGEGAPRRGATGVLEFTLP